jgi:hypothetical protein
VAAPTAGITTAYPQSTILSRYDRRGFGRSDKTRSGCDYDTLPTDLDKVIIGLDLTDASLVAVEGEIDADSCAEQLNGARTARCKVSAVRRNPGSSTEMLGAAPSSPLRAKMYSTSVYEFW